MIVPQFWAEASVQTSLGKKQLTVRRFGWSDLSQADAEKNATTRAEEALARIARGEKIPKRELKRAYNGSEGVPIREEILSRHGDVVITRNLYGARCLNTPNVLFADVDCEYDRKAPLFLPFAVISLVIAVLVGWTTHSVPLGFILGVGGLILSLMIAGRLHQASIRKSGGLEKIAETKIENFIQAHPNWHLRLYKTPSGYRLMAMHRTFDPREREVVDFFNAIGTDPIYMRMCHNQHCFRARVSPKPWRIGIDRHIQPQPGVWPIKPERMPEHRQWIENYEKISKDYAACRFVKTLGNGMVDSTTRAVQILHDELSHAQSQLPIA